MLKKNKWKIILSAMIILLPVLLGIVMWNDLPDGMTTHWGADGNADRISGKAFAVFGLPSILLVIHFVCLLFTLLDKKQQEQNQKALSMIFWIVPMISLLVNGTMYAVALGREGDIALLLPAIIGVPFIFMGNYMPKIKQNSTLGIKVWWARHNEENWNRTHRLGGKIMVAGGFIILLSSFLPVEAFLTVVLCVLALTVAIPMLYSYFIYRQHQKEGVKYDAVPPTGGERASARITMIVVPIILLAAVLLMFTGKIEVTCEDTAFRIRATYWTDIEVEYSQIDTAVYYKDLDVGLRTSGFASARLSLGIFQNEEFGTYTLYAYAGAKEFVVLTAGEKTLVIGMEDTGRTQALYETFLSKIGA